ncbi:MAG TPA: galactose oxidase early set domain-containing protein [Planctomycetota bacterium]|nr:galactose oxidase early set domain-containing protein [Planctomycetota bacterium]
MALLGANPAASDGLPRCAAALAAGLIAAAGFAQHPPSPPPAEVGQFAGPWVWGVIPDPPPPCDCSACPPPSPGRPSPCPPAFADREIGHAALFSVGAMKGQVLLWYYALHSGTRSYRFDPADPVTLHSVPQPPAPGVSTSCVQCGYDNEIAFNLFCASHTFDAEGRLIACGGLPNLALGAPAPGGCVAVPFVDVKDGVEQKPVYDPPRTWPYDCFPCSSIASVWAFFPGGGAFGPYWVRGPDMIRSRYYPSSIAVPGVHLDGPFQDFEAGAPIVIGGTLDALCGDHLEADGFWPATPSANVRVVDGRFIYGWEFARAVIGSPGTYVFHELGARAGPTGFTGGPPPTQGRLPEVPRPPEYFRFYPQAFLLGNDDPQIEEVFVAGDTHFEYFGEVVRRPGEAAPAPNGAFRTYQLANEGAFSCTIAVDPRRPDPVRVAPVIDRYYGSSTFLHTPGAPNRVLRFGGSRGFKATAAPLGLDAQASAPSVEEFDWRRMRWRAKTPLARPRVFQNAVILPDGTVFVLGGSRSDYHNAPAESRKPELVCELYDPGAGPEAAGSTRLVAALGHGRLYHAVAVLLPDARVLVAGGEDYVDAFTVPPTSVPARHSGEIYSPPYLFRGPRPTVLAVPSGSLAYASAEDPAFAVDVRIPFGDAGSDGAPTGPAFDVDPSPGHLKATLIRPGSASHHFDFDQRYLELPIRTATYLGGGAEGADYRLMVERPKNATWAVQGYYLLFVVRNGVPSVAATVRVG